MFVEDPTEPDVLLRLPMTKGVVRSVDAAEDFLANHLSRPNLVSQSDKSRYPDSGCFLAPLPNQSHGSQLFEQCSMQEVSSCGQPPLPLPKGLWFHFR